jgi:NitT/TauT family transport system ATP-binding protein
VLEIEHLSKTYGSGEGATLAVGDVTFSVAEKEFVCVVGPSGCGKTTLLKCMSGLLRPTSGEARLHGIPIVDPPRQMALVFQDYSRSLFPWMTTRGNILFPLKNKDLGKREAGQLADEAMHSVGLDGFHDHYPWQLSGGMQQRVAIARALAYQPEILLMDEPFASVDAQTRADLEDLTLKLRNDYGVTIVFVTHDIDESVYLADRVIMLTSRPTRVQELVHIDLPRPRDQVATKELPRFAELRAHVYTGIRRNPASPADPSAELEPEPAAVSA